MKKLKKSPRILSFFRKYEKFIVWMICTTIFVFLVMQMSVVVYKLKLPAIAWGIFVESISVSAFVASVLFFWMQNSGQRKQEEKIAEVAQRTKLQARQDELNRKIIAQQETDVRLEQTLNHLSVVVDDLRSQLGRLSAQVYQFEGEVELRRRINELEKILQKKCTKKVPSN
jgi:septal ring factor EnvC (AmiA/AmiB activator)